MSRRFHLTEELRAHLNACAAQKMTLTDAAREIGTTRATLVRAVWELNDERGDTFYSDWLGSKFKGAGRTCERKDTGECFEGLRKVASVQVSVPHNPQAQWLTRAWG